MRTAFFRRRPAALAALAVFGIALMAAAAPQAGAAAAGLPTAEAPLSPLGW